MAFTASCIWEVRTTGDDTNHGGGFDRGVAGFPTDGAATDANTASPVFTSASYNFAAGDVGAWVYIKSGSNWTPGFYQIASVATNAATLDAAIGKAVLDTGALNTVVGCATTASPTSGTFGVDYSQQDNSQIAFNDMVIGAAGNTTKFTSAGNPVGKNFIGNIISVTAGTGFTVQRVAIVSTSTTTATCDKALGTADSTGGTGELGGALASPGISGGLVVGTYNSVFVKTGAYTITTASANVSGGVFSGGGNYSSVIGYGAVRGDYASPPTISVAADGSVTTCTMIAGQYCFCANLILDGKLQTAIRGIDINAYSVGYLITAKNCTNSGLASGNFVASSATGCTTQPAFNSCNACYDCAAYANSISGFSGVLFAACCISYSNSGASSDGFASASKFVNYNCVSSGNGRHGFYVSSSSNPSSLVNCIAESNGGYGMSLGTYASMLNNCATYNNTSGPITPATSWHQLQIGPIAYTATAFVNAAAGNFALNNNNPGGAQLRAAGIPGVFPAGLTTGYLDIGAAQHADPAGGTRDMSSGVMRGMAGMLR